MVTLAMDTELWVRRVLEGMSTHSGAVPHSEVNEGGCPRKPIHLTTETQPAMVN